MEAEVAHRTRAMSGLLAEIRHAVLWPDYYRVQDKCVLARSRCFLRLLYNAGIWPQLSHKCTSKLAWAYVRPYRAICG
eukprot:10995534-Alexandrium_andersonii.AAC.1